MFLSLFVGMSIFFKDFVGLSERERESRRGEEREKPAATSRQPDAGRVPGP